jgi:hypothetical protein
MLGRMPSAVSLIFSLGTVNIAEINIAKMIQVYRCGSPPALTTSVLQPIFFVKVPLTHDSCMFHVYFKMGEGMSFGG